jgi:2-dehydropantoate 2-reductase
VTVQRVLVVGAGAIGGYFGALLTRAGADVAILSRNGRDDTYLSSGVRIVDGPDAGTYFPRAWTADEPSAPDLIVIAVKAYDTAAACAVVEPLVREDTTVLVLQNGIERGVAVDEALGIVRTVSSVVYLESVQESPGVVRFLSGARKIVLGGPDPAQVARVAELLRRADIVHEVPEQFPPAEWRKFSLVCAANGLTALTKGTFGDVLGNPYGPRVVWEILSEATRVASAEGVDLGGSFADEGLAFLTELGPALRSSMLRDVERGRRTEVAVLNGELVARADRTGTAAPTNRLVSLVLDMHNRRVATAGGA